MTKFADLRVGDYFTTPHDDTIYHKANNNSMQNARVFDKEKERTHPQYVNLNPQEEVTLEKLTPMSEEPTPFKAVYCYLLVDPRFKEEYAVAEAFNAGRLYFNPPDYYLKRGYSQTRDRTIDGVRYNLLRCKLVPEKVMK